MARSPASPPPAGGGTSRLRGSTPTADRFASRIVGGRGRSSRCNLEFFCAVVIIGLLAGVAGLSTTVVLRFVEHITYHYTFGTLLAGITGSSPVRRAVGPMIGGGLAGFGW